MMGNAKKIAKRIVASSRKLGKRIIASGCESPDHDDNRALDWGDQDSPDMSVGPDSLEQCDRCKLELCETCRQDHTCGGREANIDDTSDVCQEQGCGRPHRGNYSKCSECGKVLCDSCDVRDVSEEPLCMNCKGAV